jgi:uncharacterized membrane protein
MPNIAAFHPQIVHFVVALLIAGVGFRLVSLTGRLKFLSPAAATLILIGTVVAFAAVHSGTEAHGAVERIPGVRAAVQEHEEWGERARNVFVAVAALEVLVLGTAYMKSRHAKLAMIVSALAGLGGVFVLYQAADRGGDLVYSYAGGPGLRTGNPEDVGRLFAAGAYEQAMQDRQAGRFTEAATLIEEAARRFPGDLDWQLAAADSLIQDGKDPQAALERLNRLAVPAGDLRARLRVGLMKATAHQAAGDINAARTELESLRSQVADNPNFLRNIDRRLEQLKQER